MHRIMADIDRGIYAQQKKDSFAPSFRSLAEKWQDQPLYRRAKYSVLSTWTERKFLDRFETLRITSWVANLICVVCSWKEVAMLFTTLRLSEQQVLC
jgi:hypothetical protein